MSSGGPASPFVRRPPEEAVASRRLNALVFFIGSLIAVGLVGLLAATVTWAFHASPKPRCTIDCPPPEANVRAATANSAGLAEERTFKSSSFGFSVDYSSDWSVQQSGPDGALFTTKAGILEVVGLRSTASPVQLISERIGSLNRSRLPDIQPAGPIRGAHIGRVNGTGELYAATLLPSSGGGQGLLVRIGVIVAREGTLTVRVMALLPFDQGNGVIVGAGDADYGLTEFRWPGE